MPSAILRLDPAAGRFTIIGNDMVNDSRLSPETLGFAVWLLSKPPGFEIRVTALPYLLRDQNSSTGHVGRQRVRKMLKQLEVAGYLDRQRKRTSAGHWAWEFILRGVSSTIVQKPTDGFPVDGLAGDGQPVDIKQETKTKKQIIKKSKLQVRAPVAHDQTTISGLRFPEFFDSKSISLAQAFLASCPPELRQIVLNEIAWIHQRGKLRGNPCALLIELVRRAKRGEFAPNCPSTHDSKPVADSAAVDVCRVANPDRQASSKIIESIRDSLKQMPRAGS